MARGGPKSPWRVEAHPDFVKWAKGLDQDSQEKVVALRRLLEQEGPTLGRPYADRIEGSKYSNLKELRPTSRDEEALRILFYFDPARAAFLLVGGDKAGNWDEWYDENIPIAEARIEAHEKKNNLTVASGRGAANRKTKSDRKTRRRR